jgi:putative PIN family toxin of toxin-antitoxin system
MPLQIVIDTNVLNSALRSQQGASFRLLSLIGESSLFEINISVPLILEYEDVTKRYLKEMGLTQKDVSDIIDYLCSVGNRRRIYFLWRPLLKDPKDDMILELAVEAQCDYIISFNKRDFVGIQQFDLQALTPQEFLKIIGEIS